MMLQRRDVTCKHYFRGAKLLENQAVTSPNKMKDEQKRSPVRTSPCYGRRQEKRNPMSTSKPRFEQVPLEVVKKLLEKKTSDGLQKESSKVVVFEPRAKKTEPYTLPQLLRAKMPK